MLTAEVLPGLHVAAYSLLKNMSPAVAETRFFIFSDAINVAELNLLHQTLAVLKKPFTLEQRQVEPAIFNGFPPLNGSWAAYYRLIVPQALEVERFLYMDADTLCEVDVSELNTLEMGAAPAGLVPEAPLAGAVDRTVAIQLGNSPLEPYFNSGVILVNVVEWRRQRVTERAMDGIHYSVIIPLYHDRSRR